MVTPTPTIRNNFIVRNIAPSTKNVKVFKMTIAHNCTFNLMKLPWVNEAAICESLVKGELYFKIVGGELEIVFSDINLLQFNETELAFLESAGLNYGTKVTSSQIEDGISDSDLTDIQNRLNTLEELLQMPGTYQAPLVIEGQRTLTVSGSGPFNYTIAASGHVDGAEVCTIIPANQRSKLYVGANCWIDEAWIIDPTTREVTSWDSTRETKIITACRGSTLVSAIRQGPSFETTAATLTSATVFDDNPNALVLVFSKPVDPLGVTTGFSFGTFTSGTTRTITGVEAIDGATVTLTLSGNFDGSEVVNFIIGSGRVAVDLDGNLIATNAGLAVTVSFGFTALVQAAAWSIVFESGVQMLPATGLPANFTSWTDQVSGSLQLTVPGAGHPQRTAAGSVDFAGNANERITVASSLTAGTDFEIYARVRAAQAGDGAIVSCVKVSTSKWLYISVNTDRVTWSIFDGVETISGPGSDDVFTLGSTNFHHIFLSRTGSTMRLQCNNRTPVTKTATQTISSIDELHLGAMQYAGPTDFNPSHAEVSDVGIKRGAAFTAQERLDIMDYIDNR